MKTMTQQLIEDTEKGNKQKILSNANKAIAKINLTDTQMRKIGYYVNDWCADVKSGLFSPEELADDDLKWARMETNRNIKYIAIFIAGIMSERDEPFDMQHAVYYAIEILAKAYCEMEEA